MSINIVTGGGGFIGLNLVEHLLDLGETVIIVDNYSEGFNAAGHNLMVSRGAHSICVDVAHSFTLYQKVASKLQQLSDNEKVYVYHLAAQSHVDRSIDDPEYFFHNNLDATLSILRLPNLAVIEKTLVVSTDEVYGDEGPFPTELGAPYNPSSPYAASKAACDMAVMAFRRTYNLDVKISRCCNNFGKYQDGEKFIPTIIRSIKEGRPVPLYGDGKQTRQWVPVKEHVRRLVEFMHDDEHDIHVGGYSIRNIELINLISDIVGKKVEFKHVEDRKGHDVKYELYDDKSIKKNDFEKYLKEYVLESLET